MFPGTCDQLADRTGIESLRIDTRQSWAAVGLMGVLIAFLCSRGSRTEGESRLYRAAIAGLEAHVGTHLAGSVVQRGYTAGVVTAVPVMLPGTVMARRELRRRGTPLTRRDYVNGFALLVPAAIVCQAIARMVPRNVR